MKEEGIKSLNLDDVLSYLKQANVSFLEYTKLRSKYTRLFDFDDDEFGELKSKIIVTFENYLKYIIFLHQYNDFNNKLTTDIYEMEALKYLEENEVIKSFVIDELDKFDDKDYAYYFKFIELVFDKDYENIERVTQNNLSIKYSVKKFKDMDISNLEKFFLITNNFDKKRLEELLTDEEKDKYLTYCMEVISEINDNFSRISSVEGKPKSVNEKNLDDFYELVNGIRTYCYFINTNNNSFNFNLSDICYLYNAKRCISVVNRKKEDVDLLLNTYKDTLIVSYALKNNLELEDLINYSKLKFKKDFLIFLFVNGLSFENYLYLKLNGFTHECIIKIVNINGSNYENYVVDDKYFELLPYLTSKTINSLDDKKGDFLLSKLNSIKELFQNKDYDEYFLGYIKILQSKELREYVNYFKYLDFEQLKIYENINKYLNSNDKMTSDDMVKNVLDNIEAYDGQDDVINKIPLMLSFENNKIILDSLLENELYEENMKYLDGTIFCYPSDFVLRVFKMLRGKEIDVIIDNKLNANVIKYTSQLIQKQMSYEFPPQIIYRKEHFD